MAVQWALTANQYALRRAWRHADISRPLRFTALLLTTLIGSRRQADGENRR